ILPLYVRFVLRDIRDAWSNRRETIPDSRSADFLREADSDDAWQADRDRSRWSDSDWHLGALDGRTFIVRRDNVCVARREDPKHTSQLAGLFCPLLCARIFSLRYAVRDGWCDSVERGGRSAGTAS